MPKNKIVDKIKDFGRPRVLKDVLVIAFGAGLAVLLYYSRAFFSAAYVNGEAISRISLVKELEKQGGKSLLDNLVNEKLISQEAENQNVSISGEVIDGEIKKIEEFLKAQNITLEAALAQQGQTKEKLIAQIKLQKIIEAILGKRVTVTEEEIEKYYEENKSTYEDKKLEEVRNQIKEELFQQRLSSEYQKWIQELRDKAKIIFLVNY